MVGEGVCRRAYGQAQVQCSDARDLSAPLTLQRGDHSATQAQSLEPTLDMCDPNNTHSVYQCPNSKYNSTFFENMGYRGQSCEDERMLWEFIDQPFTEGWMGVC